MSVSLITGIGEKVRPSRLTTPTGGSAMCVCVCEFHRAYPSVCVFHILIYICVCVCVCDKGRGGGGGCQARPGAEIDSPAKERK